MNCTQIPLLVSISVSHTFWDHKWHQYPSRSEHPKLSSGSAPPQKALQNWNNANLSKIDKIKNNAQLQAHNSMSWFSLISVCAIAIIVDLLGLFPSLLFIFLLFDRHPFQWKKFELCFKPLNLKKAKVSIVASGFWLLIQLAMAVRCLATGWTRSNHRVNKWRWYSRLHVLFKLFILSLMPSSCCAMSIT